MKKWLKTMAWAAAAGAVLATVAVSAAGYAVQRATDGRVYASPGEVPANRAGLLLGTSRTVRSGRPNAYFYNRVDAAAALYHAGKVEYLVISGDNGRKGYNGACRRRRYTSTMPGSGRTIRSSAWKRYSGRRASR